MSDSYYALMSESSCHGMINEVELIKYYARKIQAFCKEHRCATCPFFTDKEICTFKNIPINWKGIQEVKNENND